jgi:2-phosphosulfolactate phosphatase
MTRQEIEAEKLFDATVVVIDVFLATTTLLTILENGARSVLPVASLEEAEEVGEALDRSRLLRGGEQDAEKIEGYDLGPYPEEYTPEVVGGKDVIFVTTNGTRAISSAVAGEEAPLRLPAQRPGGRPVPRSVRHGVGLRGLRGLGGTIQHRRLPRRLGYPLAA